MYPTDAMSLLRTTEIRKLNEMEIDKRLSEFKLEMAKERANISIGATTTSPGKIREMRRTIARIATIRHEIQLLKENPGDHQ